MAQGNQLLETNKNKVFACPSPVPCLSGARSSCSGMPRTSKSSGPPSEPKRGADRVASSCHRPTPTPPSSLSHPCFIKEVTAYQSHHTSLSFGRRNLGPVPCAAFAARITQRCHSPDAMCVTHCYCECLGAAENCGRKWSKTEKKIAKMAKKRFWPFWGRCWLMLATKWCL